MVRAADEVVVGGRAPHRWFGGIAHRDERTELGELVASFGDRLRRRSGVHDHLGARPGRELGQVGGEQAVVDPGRYCAELRARVDTLQ